MLIFLKIQLTPIANRLLGRFWKSCGGSFLNEKSTVIFNKIISREFSSKSRSLLFLRPFLLFEPCDKIISVVKSGPVSELHFYIHWVYQIEPCKHFCPKMMSHNFRLIKISGNQCFFFTINRWRLRVVQKMKYF